MTQFHPLLMMTVAGVVGLTVGSQRVVRSHISQGQPYYGTEHRRYLARRAMLRRQGLDGEEDGGEEIEAGEADQKYEGVVSNPLQFGLEIADEKESRSYAPHSGCEIRHETVTVVKQVPSFTKHCQKVEDTKCKTIYKNAFTTQIETQCMATFDTSCDDTLETAYKQQCKTIVDVECRIVNLESKDGHHESKKICEDVPTEKCIPVPVKVEGQKCVNVSIAIFCFCQYHTKILPFQVPTQMCENVPVTVAQEVPQQQCYKKPRKVCQTLVGTKPKVVTAQIPREVCGHETQAKQKSSFPEPPHSPSSSFPGLVPSFRPSLLSKGVEKRPETFQSEARPTGNEEYDYDNERDGEEEDGFSYPRGQSGAKPNTEGFNENLLQFLQQNK